MIVTVIIIFLLISGWVNGLRRGFILQVFHLAKMLGSLFIAWYFYGDLASHLAKVIPAPSAGGSLGMIQSILPVESAFYNIIAFVIVYIVARIVLGMIARTLDGFARLPLLNSVNKLLGGLLGFVQTYVIVFIVIVILTVIPSVSGWMVNSGLAMMIAKQTPVLSDTIKGFISI